MRCRSAIDPPRVSSQSPAIGEISSFRKDYYQCRHCKHVTPKNTTNISGYDSEHSLRHVHCPSCGRVIAWPSEGGKLKGVVEGTFLTAAGGVLGFLLYPSLNVYGLQAGFCASLYGILKIFVL